MSKLLSTLREKASSGFLIYCAVMAIILSIVAVLPLYPNDFFPYLRIGQEIVKTGHIPTTEFMTYTQFGNPAIYLYWLPSLIFLGVFQLGGVTLTAILAMICIGVFFTFLWLSLRELQIGWITSFLILVIMGLVNFTYLATRPQLLCYPLFGYALLLIIRWQNGDSRHLWFIPLIALLWVNIHASFLVLFLILIPAIIFGQGNRKLLLLLTIIALFATLFNFYGVEVWKTMFSVVKNPSNMLFSFEWSPPGNVGWQANLFFGTFLLIPILTTLAKAKIQITYWIWFLLLGWMALSAVRYIIWFLPIEVILLSLLINPFIEKHVNSSNRFQNRTLNVLMGVILLIIPIALLPGIRNLWLQKSTPVYNNMIPIGATAWLAQNPQLPDYIWSDFTYSTYLTFALPQRKVFMSNRFEDIPVDQLQDNLHVSYAYYDWSEILEKYGVNILMASMQRQSTLIAAALSSSDWKEVYRDNMAVIFLRLHP